MKLLVKVKGRKGQSVWIWHLLDLGWVTVPIRKWKNVLYDERKIEEEMWKHYRKLQQLCVDRDEAIKYRKQLEDLVDKVHEDKLIASSAPFYVDSSPLPFFGRTPPPPDKKDFEQLTNFLKKGNPMTAVQRTIADVAAMRTSGKMKTEVPPGTKIVPGADFHNDVNLPAVSTQLPERGGSNNGNNNQQSGNNHGGKNNQNNQGKKGFQYDESHLKP